MKIFITTWDLSSHFLKVYEWMANKYIPEWESFTVLGYKVFPELSERFTCLSVGESQTTWCRDYFNYFKDIKDEFIFMTMEDMVPARAINYEILNTAINLMKNDPLIGRYMLGGGEYNNIKVIHEDPLKEWFIYEYGKHPNVQSYRLSLQPSVWRTSYLLKYLDNDWTPWQFEVKGSSLADTDGHKIIASRNKFALESAHCISTTRYPGRINVQGFEPDTLAEILKLGLFSDCVLQLGEDLNAPLYQMSDT
jgi:hypothetical protein